MEIPNFVVAIIGTILFGLISRSKELADFFLSKQKLSLDNIKTAFDTTQHSIVRQLAFKYSVKVSASTKEIEYWREHPHISPYLLFRLPLANKFLAFDKQQSAYYFKKSPPGLAKRAWQFFRYFASLLLIALLVIYVVDNFNLFISKGMGTAIVWVYFLLSIVYLLSYQTIASLHWSWGLGAANQIIQMQDENRKMRYGI